MKKLLVAVCFSIVGAVQMASASATTDMWYGSFGSNHAIQKVNWIRCFQNGECLFGIANANGIVMGDQFWFNASTAQGKNWLSLLTTSKSTGQGIEFHTTTLRATQAWNVDAIGLR